MCTTDFSLKLIAASCLLIAITDSFVLQQILEKASELKYSTDPLIYYTCFEPQVEMRVVFTGYAINASAICFVLTVALMVFDEYSFWFEWFVAMVIDYMFLVFGPAMLTFCIIGISKLPGLTGTCSMSSINQQLNLVDVFILIICTLVSLAITFGYALQKTN